jgi:hypothetical protein
MAVPMQDRWTDERLDDLKGSVDGGFRRMEERFVKMDERFVRMEERLVKMDEKTDRRFEEQNVWMREEFGRMNARIDGISQPILHGSFVLSAAMVAGFVALAVAAL